MVSVWKNFIKNNLVILSLVIICLILVNKHCMFDQVEILYGGTKMLIAAGAY